MNFIIASLFLIFVTYMPQGKSANNQEYVRLCNEAINHEECILESEMNKINTFKGNMPIEIEVIPYRD